MRSPIPLPTARLRQMTRWAWFLLAPLCGMVCAREYTRPRLVALEAAREAREVASFSLADSLGAECVRLESEARDEAAPRAGDGDPRAELAARLRLYRQVTDSLQRELGRARTERRQAVEISARTRARIGVDGAEGPVLQAEVRRLDAERMRLEVRQAALADSVPRATSELEALRGRAHD